MAKKATAQKLASLWSTVAKADQALAVDFTPLKAPVALQLQRAKQVVYSEHRPKARVIRVDCYLG